MMNTVMQQQNFQMTDATSAAEHKRSVVARTFGITRGPITRLVSPSDIGQLIKPFVFLDYGVLPASKAKLFGMHPHSGIATLSLPIQGEILFADTTGETGVVKTAGLEWMKAGNGVWHDGGISGETPLEMFQLWMALPEHEENAPAQSKNIDPSEIAVVGPVSVLLGQYQATKSPIEFTAGANYYHVQLQDGEVWHYQPESGQTVAWLAIYKGNLTGTTAVSQGEMVVFDASETAIRLMAQGAASFVFGAAIPHPYPLVMGSYSVHTSREALVKGEQEIQRIGTELRLKSQI
jgi:redox-sensitive bicupin YhaK (pirin superfamily)